MTDETLKPNSLYILLFIRDSPPRPNDFHWALYLHRDPASGGTKYHIKSEGSGWIADHGDAVAVMKSFLLVGAFRIADVPEDSNEHVDRTVRTYDDRLNTAVPGITCRVWLLRVLELLRGVEGGDGGRVLRCEDVGALEGEVMRWGNENASSADLNVQPRPVADSVLCGL